MKIIRVMKRIIFWFVLTALAVLFTACRGPENPEGGASVGTSVALTVAAISANGTDVADLSTPTAVADTPATNPPAATPIPEQANTPSCTTLSGLNVRSGPGLVYDPPIAAVGINTTLQPIGFVADGFPGGTWLQVNVVGANLTGWVSADPQFIQCNVDYASLPVAAAPPTPNLPTLSPPTATATAQPTATTIARVPPDLGNVAVGGENFPADHVIGEVIVNPTFLIRMAVRDSKFFGTEGDRDGAGIDHVEFNVADADGFPVYDHAEETAAFCIFGGGEPTCNPWPTNAAGQYTWGEGGPIVQSGNYQFNVNVFSKAPEADFDFGGVWNWNFNMSVSIP